MKKVAIGLAAATLLWHASAEEPWLTDLGQAQARAKAENKMVLIDFTGSDWCPPCKALQRNVFSKQEFLDYAKTNLVLVEADFPRSKPQSEALKKANAALAARYGVEAYPTIVVLDSAGKQLKKEAGYRGETVAEFIAGLQKLKP